MSDDLHDALTEIDGVGDATAEKILAVVAEHGDAAERDPLMDKAIASAHEGDDRSAAVYLRRATEGE